MTAFYYKMLSIRYLKPCLYEENSPGYPRSVCYANQCNSYFVFVCVLQVSPRWGYCWLLIYHLCKPKYQLRNAIFSHINTNRNSLTQYESAFCNPLVKLTNISNLAPNKLKLNRNAEAISLISKLLSLYIQGLSFLCS